MADKVIVFKNPDGSCGIVHPMPEMFDPKSRTRLELAARGVTFATDDEVLQWIAEKDVPAGKPFRVTTKDKLPADRTFRNAWTDDNPGQTVAVDMEKARGLHLQRLRQIRDEKLKALDVEFTRALEAKDAAKEAEVVSKKTELRDMPALAESEMKLLRTPAAFAQYMPASLSDGT